MNKTAQFSICSTLFLVAAGFTTIGVTQASTGKVNADCAYGPAAVDLTGLSTELGGIVPQYPPGTASKNGNTYTYTGYVGPGSTGYQTVYPNTAATPLTPNPDPLANTIPANRTTPAVGALQPFRDPPVLPTKSNDKAVVSYDNLDVKYSNAKKAKIAGCGVRLRTYNGSLVAPTMRVNDGQALEVTVKNELKHSPPETGTAAADPMDDSSDTPAGNSFVAANGHNVKSTPGGAVPNPCPTGNIKGKQPAPTDLDMTNLHTHGLHVDPCGIVKTINGHKQFVASDNVLINYTPGQSQPYEFQIPAGDPAGAFWYHAHAHGSTSVDMSSGMVGALIVNNPETSAYAFLNKIPQRVMVFQQIQYDQKGEINAIPGTETLPSATPGANPVTLTWGQTQRRITINGQVMPVITMQEGSVEHWSMIGATYDKFMQIQLAGHALSEIALDSLYLPRVDTWSASQSVQLDSGYRSDVLVQAGEEPGIYMLTDSEPSVVGYPNAPDAQSVLAAVVVTPNPSAQAPLPTDAEMAAIAYRNPALAGNNLTTVWAAQPNPDSHVQTMVFNTVPQGQMGAGNYAINGVAYSDDEAPRQLVLGTTDKWPLQNALRTPHIFHIHINPFEFYRMGPNGLLELVWKDTVTIPARPIPPDMASTPGVVVMYTQYLTFTGEFVLHCHLVDHEDMGMMQNVAIVNPPTLPGS